MHVGEQRSSQAWGSLFYITRALSEFTGAAKIDHRVYTQTHARTDNNHEFVSMQIIQLLINNGGDDRISRYRSRGGRSAVCVLST